MGLGLNDWRGLGWVYTSAAWIGLLTAGLTAFYTFRLWFRVFCGPERFVMGEDHAHDDASPAAHAAEAETHAAEVDHPADDHHHAHEPHEMPWWPMNLPLLVLAAGSIGGYLLFSRFVGAGYEHGVVEALKLVEPAAHAADFHGLHHGYLFGSDVHSMVGLFSVIFVTLGVILAAVFHLFSRGLGDRAAASLGPVVPFLRGAWGIDRLYDAVIVTPLRLLAQLLHGADGLLVGGFFSGVGVLPSAAGRTLQPAQTGRLQGYGLLMIGGAAVLALVLLFAAVYLQPVPGGAAALPTAPPAAAAPA